MPLIEVEVPEGALDSAGRMLFIEELTAVVLKVEEVPDSAQSRALTWVLIKEIPKGHWAIGGQCPPDLRFLVRASVPAGTLSIARKRRMGLEIYKLLSKRCGRALRPDEAWIIVNEVPEGNWTAGGKSLRLEDIRQFMGIVVKEGHVRRP